MRKTAFLFLSACLFFACKTAEFGTKNLDVNGMIYDFENRPVAGYEVRLGEEYVSVSDITGRFLLQKVPRGVYELTGQKDNYENYAGVLSVEHQSQIVYLRVPSLDQLLKLADAALMENRLEEAAAYIERARATGSSSPELSFYEAVYHFRKKNIPAARRILEELIAEGTRDIYAEKFLAKLNAMEEKNESLSE